MLNLRIKCSKQQTCQSCCLKSSSLYIGRLSSICQISEEEKGQLESPICCGALIWRLSFLLFNDLDTELKHRDPCLGQSVAFPDKNRIHSEQMQSCNCPILIDRWLHTWRISVVCGENARHLPLKEDDEQRKKALENKINLSVPLWLSSAMQSVVVNTVAV